MFDHVAVHVVDLAASERFYRTVLAPLGIESTHVDADGIEWDDFHVVAASSTNPPTRHLHVGFVAPSREQVDEFWRVGIDAGYEDDGPPGERPQYTPGYYGAFLRDLDATSGFYVATMRHIGLREGRLWPQGRQFRGASATFRSSPTAARSPSISKSPSPRPIPKQSTISIGTRSRSAIKTPVRLASESGMGRAATQRQPSIPVGRRSKSAFRQPR